MVAGGRLSSSPGAPRRSSGSLHGKLRRFRRLQAGAGSKVQGEQGAPTVGRATAAALAQSAADPIMHSPVLIGDAAAGSAGWLWLAGWLCFHGGAAASTGWAPQSDGGRQLLLTAAGAEIDRRWGRCTRVGGRGQRAVAAGGLAGGKAMAKESSQVSQESGSAMQPAGWRGLAFSSRRHLSVRMRARV